MINNLAQLDYGHYQALLIKEKDERCIIRFAFNEKLGASRGQDRQTGSRSRQKSGQGAFFYLTGLDIVKIEDTEANFRGKKLFLNLSDKNQFFVNYTLKIIFAP